MSLIKPFRGGFKNGINTYNDTYDQTGMNFDILIMEKDETFSICEGEKEIEAIIFAAAEPLDAVSYTHLTLPTNREV